MNNLENAKDVVRQALEEKANCKFIAAVSWDLWQWMFNDMEEIHNIDHEFLYGSSIRTNTGVKYFELFHVNETQGAKLYSDYMKIWNDSILLDIQKKSYV